MQNKINFLEKFKSLPKKQKIVIIILAVALIGYFSNNKSGSSYSSGSAYESSHSSFDKCSDMSSYNFGYDIARDQQGLAADCDYLYDIGKTQRNNLNKYCFCKGVEDFRSGK